MQKYSRSALLFLLALLLSCDSLPPTAPLLRLRLSGLPDGADKVAVSITVNGKTEVVEFTPNGTDPLDTLTVGFPQGTTGTITVSILAYQGMCLVGSGSSGLTLTGDDVRELMIMVKMPSLACGTPAAQVIVQLAAGPNSAGIVKSVDPPTGINCGADCDEVYAVGTTVTLHADSTMGSFLGWSGACTDTNDCVLNLNAEGQYVVQALFGVRTCTGWCPDVVPASVNGNLNAISGTGQGNIVVVGDGGQIVRFDGQSWKAEDSGITQALRGVTAVRGAPMPTYVAVGDTGKVVTSTNGMNPWTLLTGTNTQSTKLRSVMGYYAGNAYTIYAVGDGGLILKGSLTNLSTATSGGEAVPTSLSGKNLNSIALQVNPTTSMEYLVVGDMNAVGRKEPFAAWDQTVTGAAPNLAGGWYSKTRLVFVGAVGAVPAIYSRVYSGFFPSWQAVATETVPTGAGKLTAVWGSSETNILAVGEGGTIIKWDGTSWSKQTTNTNKNLFAVWGTGSTNVYAVGAGGTILHYLP